MPSARSPRPMQAPSGDASANDSVPPSVLDTPPHRSLSANAEGSSLERMLSGIAARSHSIIYSQREAGRRVIDLEQFTNELHDGMVKHGILKQATDYAPDPVATTSSVHVHD